MKTLSKKELLARLRSIEKFASYYAGCECSYGDEHYPGECWPCRMMTICNLANTDDVNL